MTEFFILRGRDIEPVETLEDWARQFNEDMRRVASTQIGDVHISTVFLGINHAHFDGPPLVFETMIFGGQHHEYQTRAATWEEAEKQHAEAVALVKSSAH